MWTHDSENTEVFLSLIHIGKNIQLIKYKVKRPNIWNGYVFVWTWNCKKRNMLTVNEITSADNDE